MASVAAQERTEAKIATRISFSYKASNPTRSCVEIVDRSESRNLEVSLR